MDNIITKIRGELKENGNPENVNGAQRFFKEKIKLYGVKNPASKKIGKKYFNEIKNKNKTEIFDLCSELWKSGYFEESIIAGDWAYSIRKNLEPKDFKIFEKWIKNYVGNWASCDNLCNHTVGAFLEMYPEYASNIKKWTGSKNRWMRRASAVSFIIPAGRGKFLKEIIEIADLLLLDEDDLVQKGYGWMLKAASAKHLKEIFDFVMKRKTKMPRTALRYAIEKMPKELKLKAMEKN